MYICVVFSVETVHTLKEEEAVVVWRKVVAHQNWSAGILASTSDFFGDKKMFGCETISGINRWPKENANRFLLFKNQLF